MGQAGRRNSKQSGIREKDPTGEPRLVAMVSPITTVA